MRVYLALSELDCLLPPFCDLESSSMDYASNMCFVWQDEWELEKRKMPAMYNIDGSLAVQSLVLQICWQEIQRMTSS